MLKWDEKHDKAKQIINKALDNAASWKAVEELEGLNEEEKVQVHEELAVMLASIRKRYKLDVGLPQQAVQIQPEDVKVEIPMEKPEEMKPEPINEVKEEDKPKRGRKAASAEKKVPARKPRTKKTGKEAKDDEKESA